MTVEPMEMLDSQASGSMNCGLGNLKRYMNYQKQNYRENRFEAGSSHSAELRDQLKKEEIERFSKAGWKCKCDGMPQKLQG